MSDYFSNLVARARATEAVLRPNLASYFEPVREAPPTPDFSRGDAETAPAQPLVPAVRPEAPPHPARAQPAVDAPPRPEPADSRSPASVAAPQPQGQAPRAPNRITGSEAPPAGVPATRTMPVESPERVKPADPAIVPIVEASWKLAAFNPAVPDAAPGVRSSRGASSEAAGSSAAASAAPFPPAGAAPEPTVGVPAAGAMNFPPAFPRLMTPRRTAREPHRGAEGSRYAAANSAAQADAPPSVHVTIGRLEIRAVTPPAPAVAARPGTWGPRLSLDEYLRGKSGGSR